MARRSRSRNRQNTHYRRRSRYKTGASGDVYDQAYNAAYNELADGGDTESAAKAAAEVAGAAAAAAACAAVGAGAASPLCATIGAEIAGFIVEEVWPTISALWSPAKGSPQWGMHWVQIYRNAFLPDEPWDWTKGDSERWLKERGLWQLCRTLDRSTYIPPMPPVGVCVTADRGPSYKQKYTVEEEFEANVKRELSEKIRVESYRVFLATAIAKQAKFHSGIKPGTTLRKKPSGATGAIVAAGIGLALALVLAML